MVIDNTAAPEGEAAEAAGEDGSDPNRLPYVVVRMSAAMKAALQTWCKDQNPAQVPSVLGRELLAQKIGWDLANDPDIPATTGTRQKYADDAAREAGKLRNRKRTSLLRTALYNVHQGMMKKKPLLVEVAQAAVIALADDKVTIEVINQHETSLNAAIKAGK
jgi:hypothetical protein